MVNAVACGQQRMLLQHLQSCMHILGVSGFYFTFRAFKVYANVIRYQYIQYVKARCVSKSSLAKPLFCKVRKQEGKIQDRQLISHFNYCFLTT